jgi:hypothetical protein
MKLGGCEALSQSLIKVGCAEIIVQSAEGFPALHFVKSCFPKSKVKVHVVNCGQVTV